MLSKEFLSLVRDIIHSDEFESMKRYRHHIKVSVYDHSVKVAYFCYRHHKRFGTKVDLREMVRGALLHDYYLYNAHDKSDPHRFHWFKHPRCALRNALEQYPLTETQQDMIRRHMFPLTPVPPSTKAGWIVCFYDKVAAVSDLFGENRWKQRENQCFVGICLKKAKKFSN